jgi:hypothetical protein
VPLGSLKLASLKNTAVPEPKLRTALSMLCAHTDKQLVSSNVAHMTCADDDNAGEAWIEEWHR